MNILISHSWLSKYLKTDANPKQIAKSLSLCGPSVEKIQKVENDNIFDIEVTTNRVDMMSVIGIAREALAILPQFGFKAKLLPLKLARIKNNKEIGIKIINNKKVCKRILAIKLENVKIGPSPKWLQESLMKVGQRPLNNAIDITNYVMWEVGHPIHAFDYDKITTKNIIVREAKAGEKLTTLDNKILTMVGGEVVFDNGKGEIIDLPGIMGTKNTVVSNDTKNVLLWIESVNPEKIRFASMNHSIRSQAAILNEKHVDPELGITAILRAVHIYQKVSGAKIGSKLIDIYEKPKKQKTVQIKHKFIEERLGVEIDKNKITNILTLLGFTTKWSGNTATVNIPSFRSHDINIEEDVVEEVARIYGYHNFPSKLMSGELPEKLKSSPFEFENKLKHLLMDLGAIEVYTLSLVPKEWTDGKALKLKNPLGKETEYLRTNLKHSLIDVLRVNSSEKDPFHIFEIAHVYLPKTGVLPEEKMILAGTSQHLNYRKMKGLIDTFIQKLNINPVYTPQEGRGYKAGRRLKITKNNKYLGEMGILENGCFYYQFEVENLQKESKNISTYKPAPKYPPQIEDITFKLPGKTKVGDVISNILKVKNVGNVILGDIFESSYTFRIWYQSPIKTLTNNEVEKIRTQVFNAVKKKFGGIVKT